MTLVYRNERVPLVIETLEIRPWCEASPRIRVVVPGYTGCWGRSTELHELKKRSAGGSITDIDNILAVCHPCNCWIEDWPAKARQAGLVISIKSD